MDKITIGNVGTPGTPELLLPAEAARLLRVDPKTVSVWARKGRIRSARTPSGHRRYYAADIRAMLNGQDGGRS